MKSVKKMLKEEAKSVLPSGEVKQNILREMGWEEPQREYALAGGGTRARAGKKLTVGLIAAFLALAVVLCVLLPVFLRGNSPVSDTLNKFDKITDADSFYAYGALSAGTLLSSRTDGAAAVSLPDAVSAKALNTARSSEEDTLTSLNRYMSLVESLLGEEDITETAVAPAQGYAFGMEVHGGSLLGGGVTCRLYYDKLYIGGETDDGESEENYSIDGILVTESGTYPVSGTYETETESGESESELFFRAYLDEGRASYIEVREETESETEEGGSETEREFVYTLIENGERAERTTLSYEEEEGELELEMTIERGGSRDTLYFEREREGGEQVLSAHGTLGGQNVRFRVYIRSGQYHYVFEDGSSSDHVRPGHDDDDDDDDD